MSISLNTNHQKHVTSRTSVIIHTILFLLVFTYGSKFISHFSSITNFPWFKTLDELTGKPFLTSRIVSFIFAGIIYIIFTLCWERENWKKALFIYNPLPGLARGTAYAFILLVTSFALLLITKLVVVNGFTTSINHIILLIFAWCIAQFFNAIKEEFIYRGYVLRRLSEKFNKHASVLLVSVIFGLEHYTQYHFLGVIFATVFGLICGYLYLFYEDIYIPIGMHAIWDIGSHTLLNGKIFSFTISSHTAFMRINTELFYYLIILFVNILFLGLFFVYKKLWRL